MKTAFTTKELAPLGYSAFVLIIITILGGIFTATSVKTISYLAFAIFFYLISPGYFILLNFKNLDGLERIILGMVTSSAIIPLILYTVNVLGARLSIRNSMITILAVILIASFIKLYGDKHNA